MKLFRSSALLAAATAALSACAADFTISSSTAAAPAEALGDNEPLAATWTVSGDTALTALQLQTLGRVFVEYDASLAKADNTTLAKIVLSGNSSALLDAFEVVAVENRESEAVEVHMKNDAFEGQGYLLTRVLVASKQTLRELSVAWSSDTVVGDDVLASSNATGTVSLSLAGSADVFVGSDDATWTVGSLVTSVSGSGNIQLLANSLAADDVALSVVGSGDVAVVADEANVKNSLASVVAGSGDITVQSGELTVYNLTTAIAGSGDVTYSKKGSCQEQAIALAGSGDVSAGSIVCVNTDVSLVGSGDVLVQTTGNLTVSSLFGSEIRYFGPEPSSISVSGLFNFRGSHKNTRKVVKEAKRNSYDEYDVEAAPKREPVYVLVKTSSSLFSNEPKIRYDLEIDTYDAETIAEFLESQGADYQVRLNAVTTQNSVVAHAAVHAPRSALLAFVGAALVAVGVAATKYQRRATRASYQPLL